MMVGDVFALIYTIREIKVCNLYRSAIPNKHI